jgi:UDP-glucose:(heptosyl)LPS alpha-1,3-glucosyltransferase
LNIALVILHADPARGGAERYTVDLAAALARRGHAVSLLASSFAAPIAGVTNVPIDATGLTRAGRYRGFLNALDAHLTKTSYDIVHAMLPVRRCDVYHPHAGMAVAAEQKWNIHLNRRRKRMAVVERELLTGDRPPITIALSEYVKRSIRQHYDLPDERLATLFNAVDLDRFQSAQRSHRQSVNGLFIGHDFERKGLAQTFQAARALNDPRLTITVIGNGPPLIPPPNAATRFNYVREVIDPRSYYADADFFVLPTKHDPCSLVVLEALAMGLPVISTVFNGATEIMTDGVHGYVLKDPTDIDALADAMRKMLDPDRRHAMREACLALRPKLSYERHLDELMKIYERAIANQSHR